MPDESLDRLLAIDRPLHCVSGNGERAVLDVLAGRAASSVPPSARAVVEWTAAQLSEEHERWISNWSPTVRLSLGGIGDVVFCHATPRSDTEIFTRETSDERIAPAFIGIDAALVVCGHTHMPFDRTLGALRIVNAGSVGMPFGATGASWLILGADVVPCHTTYDLARAADRVRETRYPQADEFAERHILAPPSESQMLELLARSAMR